VECTQLKRVIGSNLNEPCASYSDLGDWDVLAKEKVAVYLVCRRIGQSVFRRRYYMVPDQAVLLLLYL
jgi:hypothetical protein